MAAFRRVRSEKKTLWKFMAKYGARRVQINKNIEDINNNITLHYSTIIKF